MSKDDICQAIESRIPFVGTAFIENENHSLFTITVGLTLTDGSKVREVLDDTKIKLKDVLPMGFLFKFSAYELLGYDE
jgi:hypothetical protein